MRNFVGFLMIVGLAFGGGWCYYFAGYYIDGYKMEDVCGTAALTWVAYADKARAQQTLGVELERRGIDENPSAEDCDFYEEGSNKVVQCHWQVDVYPPVGGARRLKFDVKRIATPDSKLL